MRRCGVIGSPIKHSLSPLLHRSAYELLGIADQFSYDAFEVTRDELDDFIAGLDEAWVGLSVTAPNKQALLGHGVADPVATRLRSGNTLLLGRHGEPNRVHNTDVTGMLAALAGAGVTRVRHAVLLGNGATARSAVWALGQLAAEHVVVLARDADRAHSSLDRIAADAGIALEVQAFGRPAVLPAAAGAKADLLVNTVPIQYPGHLAAALVGQTRAVFEVVYNSYPSAFDRAARAAGITSLDGLDLLVAQGVEQIRLMTGRDVDPAPLLRVMRTEVLRRRAAVS